MRTLIKKIIFNHVGEFFTCEFYIRGLIQIYKSHFIWDLRPPTLTSNIENLKKQLTKITCGIYVIDLELEDNVIRGRM